MKIQTTKKKFEKELLVNFKKIKINKSKNIFVASNLKKISQIRLKKEIKLNIIFNSLKKSIGRNWSIFVPTATMNLCNKKDIFDVDNTPSKDMGSFSEYVRKKKNSVRSIHPYWSVTGIGQNAKVLKKISKHAYGYGSPWSKMLDLDFLQVNIGIHPSRAVTLVHHVETIVGVPYRYSKSFNHNIKNKNKICEDRFYQSVFFNEVNSQKKN